MAEAAQKQTVILLVIIAALLAAIAGVIIYQQNSSTPDPVATTATTQPAATGQPTDGAAGGSATGIAPAGSEFDPATAPVVPADMTPGEFVNEYYELTMAGSYDEAYVMLPTATQAYYGDSSGFANTLQGYGITSFSIEEPVEDGDTVTVLGHQDAQGMTFSYQWTIVKGEDGTWLVRSRDMAGM